MRRHRSVSLEAIRQSLNVTCPHCQVVLDPTERQRTDGTHLVCLKCGKEFEPKQPDSGMSPAGRRSGL